jgi:sugar O-acyltransferase (sialic acid O-acetyltransferase NeuD family)
MTFSDQIPELFVYGAGGHGRVVADSAARAGVRSVAFVDDRPAVPQVQGWPVIAPGDLPPEVWTRAHFIVAIGSNDIRARIFAQLTSMGAAAVSVIDPSSLISDHAVIGAGTFVAPGAIVNTGAQIGVDCVINTGASVDHDCRVGDHSQVSPRVCLAGNVWLGKNVMIGVGVVVVPGRRIGARTVVGAGAVVTRDLPDDVVAWGCPARVVRTSKVPAGSECPTQFD